MNRYDTDAAWTGYVIFKDGVPFQAAYRVFGPKRRDGLDNLRCWLSTVDGPMPIDIARFVMIAFAKEVATEWFGR
jgi:hypothetical protein